MTQPLSIALGIRRLSAGGGLEDLCLRIARALADRGHNARIYTTGDEVASSVEVVRLNHSVSGRTNHRRSAAFARAFGDVTGGKYDRIVGFQPMPAHTLVLADRTFARPDIPRWKRFLPRYRTYTRLEAACLGPGHHTRLAGLAPAQVAEYATRYHLRPDRLAVLPPTIDADGRRTEALTADEKLRCRKLLGIDPTAPIWLWVGLQPHTKGLDRLVRALPSAPDVQLVVCGLSETDRKMRPINRLARRLGVGPQVRCLGFLPHDDRFFAALSAADLLAHPARTETTGAVILEAIVNGLPAVTTGLCGYSGHVRKSGAGVVIEEPFSQGDLLSALSTAFNDRNQLSHRGLACGRDPTLYSGINQAVKLIETPLDTPWPSSDLMKQHNEAGPTAQAGSTLT